MTEVNKNENFNFNEKPKVKEVKEVVKEIVEKVIKEKPKPSPITFKIRINLSLLPDGEKKEWIKNHLFVKKHQWLGRSWADMAVVELPILYLKDKEILAHFSTFSIEIIEE